MSVVEQVFWVALFSLALVMLAYALCSLVLVIIALIPCPETTPQRRSDGDEASGNTCELPEHLGLAAFSLAECPKCSSRWALRVSKTWLGNIYSWMLISPTKDLCRGDDK